jgi:uncharacterized RDD family membrane protein YckC
MANEKRRVLDNLLAVKTPENISFQFRMAGPFRRLFAFLLDVLILFAATIIVSLVITIISVFTAVAGAEIASLVSGTLSGLFLAGLFFVYWFYTAIMETFWNGQTFGKMAMRLRTLSSNGEAIDGVQAFLRNFFRLIDVSPVVSGFVLFGEGFDTPGVFPMFMFGLITMMVSRKFQRIGDLVAGTIVVHEKRNWSHGLAKFDDPRVPQLADIIPHDFYVSTDMAKALASFVDRRRFLPYQRVDEIAAHLARPILARIGLPSDTNYDLLLCAIYYKTYVASVVSEDDEVVNAFAGAQVSSGLPMTGVAGGVQ